ncbi:hypothetical protein R4Q14_14965 [Brachyspira intermedia]|uniref:hypothetical protein n=1 Tax=Brachyspira intermedia TaxID=84377 RepID=UPI003007D56A
MNINSLSNKNIKKSISADSTIEDFPISNLSGLIESINKLEDDITKALNDTPASILFDKSLSNGFSEGDKDKETEISIIESFRENKLTPLYNLTDYYVMLKAWDSAFIDDMRYKYSEYQDKTDSEIFRSWADNFTYKYGNLFPEPESVTQDNNAKKLDNLLKAQQLGANPADLQEELNESEIFKNEMELDSPPQGMDGMEGAEDDEAMFDYSKNNSEDEANFNKPPSVSGIKADSDAYSGQSPNFKEEEHERDKDGKFTKGSGEDNKQEDKEETNNEDSSEEKQKEEKEIKEKIEQLEKIDWTKDNTLPNFPKSFLKKQGLEDKPILLKKNIIERNKQQHPDITEEQAIRILGNSLYRTEAILKGKSKRPDYYNLITRIDNNYNDLVTVELSNEKDNYEIVHFFIIRNTTRKKYEDDDTELKNKS